MSIAYDHPVLGLGPDLPWEDEPSPGNLRLSMGRILTCLSLLMPAFSLLYSPPLLSVWLQSVHDAPLPLPCTHQHSPSSSQALAFNRSALALCLPSDRRLSPYAFLRMAGSRLSNRRQFLILREIWPLLLPFSLKLFHSSAKAAKRPLVCSLDCIGEYTEIHSFGGRF